MTSPKTLPFVMRLLFAVVVFDTSILTIAWLAPATSSSLSAFLTFDRLLTALGTVGSTFIGAWLAFSFAKRGRQAEKLEAEVVAGNRALFTLVRMWNALKQHQLEITNEFRNRPDRWLRYTPNPVHMPDLTFDLKELSFILEQDADVYQSLFLEDDRYRSCTVLLDLHRKELTEKAWPLLEAAKVAHGESRTTEEFETILGPAITQNLKNYTASIVAAVDGNVASLQQAFNAVRAALKERHPKTKFINTEFRTKSDYKVQLRIPDRSKPKR